MIPRPSRRLALAPAWLAIGLAVAPSVRAAVATMPFEEVRAGMQGTGRTVFHGSAVESFDVEILGTLPNVGPDQNLILARLSGGPLAETGVLAGMSGSPVTIDGKLVGAVAYSWGFAKDAIAGVTPIEEMLTVAALGEGESRRTGIAAPAFHQGRLHSAAALRTFLAGLSERVLPQRGQTMSVPLSVAGIDPQGLARVAPGLLRPLRSSRPLHDPM